MTHTTYYHIGTDKGGKRKSSSWKKPIVLHSAILVFFFLVLGGLFLYADNCTSAIEQRSLGNQRYRGFSAHNCVEQSTIATKRNTKMQTSFGQLVHKSYNMSSTPVSAKRQAFDLSHWKQNKPNGDLRNSDYTLLAKIYSQANSVFEFGLGESTLLAHHLGLPRYVGLDPDPIYVTMIREKVSSHFRFLWGDTGKTDVWGRPDNKLLPKNVYNYQIAPLMTEYKAFDVYMVNGSWRLPCMFASFLHASAREMEGKGTTLPSHKKYDTHTAVILRDCFSKEGRSLPSDMVGNRDRDRELYLAADHLLDLVAHSGQRMCVYKRKLATSDQDLLDMWMNNYNETR